MTQILDVVIASTVPPIPLDVVKTHCRVDSSDTAEDVLLGLYLDAVTVAAESYLKRTLVQRQYVLTRDLLPMSSHRPTGNVAVNAFLNSSVYPYTIGNIFEIVKPPLMSIDLVEYQDTSGTWQTLDASLYVYVHGSPGRIAPAYGKVWPFVLPQIGSVRIKYTAGFGTTTTVVAINSDTMMTSTTITTTGPGKVTPAVYSGNTLVTPELPYVVVVVTRATINTDVAGTVDVSNVPSNIKAGILLWVGSLFKNREAVTEGSLATFPYGVKELFDSASRGFYK